MDGLRGLAILLVILFHLALTVRATWKPLLPFLYFGWSGVDLFFVLSGFLIGGILIDHRNSGNYFGAFYARRFFRIIPIYALILAVYGLLWAMGGAIRALLVSNIGPPMNWYAYATFTNNFWVAHNNSMFAFLPVSWSLAVEEQFYLTLPLIVRLVPPKHLGKVVLGVILVTAGLRAEACWFRFVTQNQAYVLPWFRADALMIGVGCALLSRNEQCMRFTRKNTWLLYFALAFLALAIYRTGTALPNSDAGTRTPVMIYGLTLIALFYAGLLFLPLIAPGHLPASLMRLRPLRAVGKVSYCVYLLHEALIVTVVATLPDILGKDTGMTRWASGFLSVAVVFAVAQLSWKLLESCMLKIGHRFRYDASKVPAVLKVEPIEEGAGAEATESAA